MKDLRRKQAILLNMNRLKGHKNVDAGNIK